MKDITANKLQKRILYLVKKWRSEGTRTTNAALLRCAKELRQLATTEAEQ